MFVCDVKQIFLRDFSALFFCIALNMPGAQTLTCRNRG